MASSMEVMVGTGAPIVLGYLCHRPHSPEFGAAATA
jgi:hypothetical protein